MPEAKKPTIKTKAAGKAKLSVPETPGTQLATQSMRNFLIITISVTVLVVLVGGYFAYNLAQSNVKRALEVRAQEYQIKLTENKLAKLDEYKTRLEEIKRADGDRPSKFEFITERTLPEDESFDDILTIFSTLEKEQAVKVEAITRTNAAISGQASSTTSTSGESGGSQSSTQSPKSQTHPISIKATGSREAIIGLMRSLEKSSRVFDFSSMKIDGDKTKPYTLDIQYRIYSFAKPSIAPVEVKIDQFEANKGDYE